MVQGIISFTIVPPPVEGIAQRYKLPADGFSGFKHTGAGKV